MNLHLAKNIVNKVNEFIPLIKTIINAINDYQNREDYLNNFRDYLEQILPGLNKYEKILHEKINGNEKTFHSLLNSLNNLSSFIQERSNDNFFKKLFFSGFFFNKYEI